MCVLLRLPSLFPPLYLALLHRPTTERRPREEWLNSSPPKSAFCWDWLPKKVDSVSKKVSNHPKKVDFFLRKLTKKSQKSCSIKNNSLPLHREPAPRVVWHHWRRVADILKRRLLALCSDVLKSRKFHAYTELSNDRCPTGYRLSLLCLFGMPFAYILMRARVP